MKKYFVLLIMLCTVSLVHSAVRWERGVKMTGWYNRDPYGQTWSWKTGVEINAIGRTAFSTWANILKLQYGKINSLVVNNEQISPNNAVISTNFIKNITAFTFWNFYLAANQLIEVPAGGSSQLYTESFISYGKNFSRYLTLTAGLKGSKNENADLQPWLRVYMSYNKPIGYRTLLTYSASYNNSLKDTNTNKIESELNLSYKLGKKLSVKITAITAKDSGSTELYRNETIDLVYDLLYSGAATY